MSWRLFWKLDAFVCLVLIGGVFIVAGLPDNHIVPAMLLALIVACIITSVLFIGILLVKGFRHANGQRWSGATALSQAGLGMIALSVVYLPSSLALANLMDRQVFDHLPLPGMAALFAGLVLSLLRFRTQRTG